MNRTFFLGGALAAAVVLSAPLTAQAQRLTIDRPGVYVLQRNITVNSGDGIVITASGVTLDLNGRTVATETPGTGRGIAISNAKGVVVKNGKIGPFAMNVFGDTIENCTLDSLQIVGNGLPPAGGPVEMGFALIASRGTVVSNNTVTSCNLGLIIRGAASGGNRIFNNSFVGSPTAANNLLGLCWNPLAGGASTDPGPVGDLIYNNHISQYRTALSASAGSKNIVFRENVLTFTVAAFSGSTFATASNNNVDSDNILNPIN
jgi:parallel beta-helix repeat protein